MKIVLHITLLWSLFRHLRYERARKLTVRGRIVADRLKLHIVNVQKLTVDVHVDKNGDGSHLG